MPTPSVTGLVLIDDCDTNLRQIPYGDSNFIDSTADNHYVGQGVNGSAAYGFFSFSPVIADWGARLPIAGGPLDLTNKFFIAHIRQELYAFDIEQTTTGVGIGFNSGSSGANARFWNVSGKGAEFPSLDGIIINPAATAMAKFNSTFDITDVTDIEIGINRVSSNVRYDSMWYIDGTINLINGQSGDPASFDSLYSYFTANDLRPFSGQSDNAPFALFPLSVGDGTTATYFRDSVKFVEFERKADLTNATVTDRTGRAHINDNDLGFRFNASASCDYDASLFFFSSQTPFFFELLGSPLNAVLTTWVIDGAGIVNISDSYTLNSFTFANCVEIQATAPTINGGAVTDGAGLRLESLSNVSGISFENNTKGLIVDIAGSAFMDLDACTFSGNTIDIEYTGTGTLTLNQTNGSNPDAGKLSTPGGGTIVLQGATIEQGIRFTSLQTDSQVIVYEEGTTNIITSVSSSTDVFDWREGYVADRNVDYTILKEGYLPIRVTSFPLGNSVAPVQAQQVEDRTYSASTGLTFGTTVTVDTVAKTFAVTTATTVQNLRNALIEFWRAETSLRNVEFPVITNGPNSFTFTGGWELTALSFNNLSRDGVRYLDNTGTLTASWAAILSSGIPSGVQSELQQVSAAAPSDARSTGNIDELIQVFGDSTHGNFDYRNYLYIKAQPNGYVEGGVDVVSQYGTLEDQLYNVVVLPEQIDGFTLGDPAITGVTITDHGATPVSWNGKDYSITITDTGGNTGEAIHRWLNYNKSLDATFQGFEPFNIFDMVVLAGSSYETQTGEIIGGSGASPKGVRVVTGSGDPHPFFSRFQADDGTYYEPPQSITLEAPNLTAGRVQLYNVTTLTEVENTTITSGYTAGWVDGTDFTAGDTLRLRWTAADKQEIEAFTTAPATGSVSIVDSPVSDDVYVNNGVDGSTVTTFAADYVDDEVDLVVGSNFNGTDLYAWWKYNLTTAQGISEFFGGCTAVDQANYRFNSSVVSIYLDNTTATNVIQLDNVRLYRSDETYPVKSPTTGSGGIDVNWRDKVFLSVTGSGALTTAQAAQLAAAATSKYTQGELHADLDAYSNKDDFKSDLTTALIADGVLGRSLAGSADGGRTVRDALRANRNRVEIDEGAGLISVYEEDDTTVAWQASITTGQRDAINTVDPT